MLALVPLPWVVTSDSGDAEAVDALADDLDRLLERSSVTAPPVGTGRRQDHLRPAAQVQSQFGGVRLARPERPDAERDDDDPGIARVRWRACSRLSVAATVVSPVRPARPGPAGPSCPPSGRGCPGDGPAGPSCEAVRRDPAVPGPGTGPSPLRSMEDAPHWSRTRATPQACRPRGGTPQASRRSLASGDPSDGVSGSQRARGSMIRATAAATYRTVTPGRSRGPSGRPRPP